MLSTNLSGSLCQPGFCRLLLKCLLMNRQGDIRTGLISQTASPRSPKPPDRVVALAVCVISRAAELACLWGWNWVIAVPFYLTGLGPVGEIWPRWEIEPAQTADHKSLYISFFPGDPHGSVNASAHLYRLDNSIIHKHYPQQQEQSFWSIKVGGWLCSLSSELYLPPPSALFPCLTIIDLLGI